MTDLAQLFLTHKPSPAPQFLANTFLSHSAPPVKNLFGTKTLPPQPPQQKPALHASSLLASPLQRSEKQLSKLTVNTQAMNEQIQHFNQLHFKQFARKTLFLSAAIFTFQLFGLLNGKICFESILFGVSLLALESNIISLKSLKIFTNFLPTLTYLALFYDILTLHNIGANYHMTLVNVPALLISIGAMINFTYFRKVAFLASDNTKSLPISSKWIQMLQKFIKSYLLRANEHLKLIKYTLSLNLLLLLGFIIYCMLNTKNALFASTLVHLPYGIRVYMIVDFLVYSVEFVSREINLFSLKQKFYQIDVAVGLLRIKPDQPNDQIRKIHYRCLVELAKQLKKNPDYLHTSVKVNYAINSYRDIFQIYAIEDLNTLLGSLNQIAINISKNNKTIESNKTLKQDLFIIVKKYIARINNNLLIYKFLAQIQKRKLLFLILNKLASEEPLKNRILDLVDDVITTANKASMGRFQFELSHTRIALWSREMASLKTNLKEGTTKSTVELGERDENGWRHYKRANRLDVAEN